MVTHDKGIDENEKRKNIQLFEMKIDLKKMSCIILFSLSMMG